MPAASPRLLLTTAALGAAGVGVLALPASAETTVQRPSAFTSTITVTAAADEVAADTSGDSSASATFVLELDSLNDVLCWSITTRGLEPPYQSPARTATHIHEGPAGQSGPPRVAFPDPSAEDPQAPRTSAGCAQGPFTTGVTGPSGGDTGTGFTVAELERDATGYYVDVHTQNFPAGSVRAQLPAAQPVAGAPAPAAPASPAPSPSVAATAAPQQEVPVGGVDAGLGGPAAGDDLPAAAALAAGLLALSGAATGAALLGRRRPAAVAVRDER